MIRVMAASGQRLILSPLPLQVSRRRRGLPCVGEGADFHDCRGGRRRLPVVAGSLKSAFFLQSWRKPLKPTISGNVIKGLGVIVRAGPDKRESSEGN